MPSSDDNAPSPPNPPKPEIHPALGVVGIFIVFGPLLLALYAVKADEARMAATIAANAARPRGRTRV